MQNRAARIVTRISYEDADHAILLRELEWLSISQMIALSLIYKVKNGHTPGHTRQMFEGCEDIHNHNTRSVSSGNFSIKKMNTAKNQTRFAYSGEMAYNNLPESLKSSVSLEAFQRNLKSIYWKFLGELAVINSIQQFFSLTILCTHKHT